MALDPVPFVVGGYAEHGPDVFRLLAYLATNGNAGIVSPTNLKVVPLDVPSAGVKVGSGAASVLNALATQQAYAVRNPNTDTTSVRIAATGSSSERSDMVIVRVDNPYVDGNAQAPADPVHGPYVRFDVLVGVPSTAQDISDVPGQEGTSGLALARIDLPKSTGTVTASMITDLRKMANPYSDGFMLQAAPASGGSNLTGSGFAFWPDNSYTIDIPKRATHMLARLEFQGGQTAGQVAGQIRLVLGSGSALYPFGTYEYNYPNPGQQSRTEVVAAGELKLPTAVKGTSQTLRMQGLRSSGTGNLFTVDRSYYNAQIQFVERPA